MTTTEHGSCGRFIVGMLVVRGIVTPEDAERATEIAEEELSPWLSDKRTQQRVAVF